MANKTVVTAEPDKQELFITREFDAPRELVSEIAFRVMRRVGAAMSAPAYHASTTVCSRPKARNATSRPSAVSAVRSLWRSEFRRTRFR